MDKSQLSEQDIRSKYITPAIVDAGWDLQTQVLEGYGFTDGRVLIGSNKRGKRKEADYLLSYKKDTPLAIVEAKSNKYSVGHGMQQALEYARLLDVPCVFSSNGDGFLFHDRTNKQMPEKELRLDEFPSPQELYQKLRIYKGNLSPQEEEIATSDFYQDSNKEPRYYQRVAINRVVTAVAKGQKRILLVMATGTGKTLVAFQTIYRLWKTGHKKRILFLADRNILIDQTKTNDFKHFGDKMTKITKRQIDKAYEIYLSLYQAVDSPDEDKKIYKQFSPDFFDLIVVDECHRGSAKEDSAWREVLEYFSSATQIGMTATPKETKDVSNIDYFGEPVYTYSLKEGIDDGFLAPYKVVRVTIDKDVEGYRPVKGELDKSGEEIPDAVYRSSDFDRKIVIDERTQLVAKNITEYMKNSNDRFMKTIVFCVDIEHAERMRQALVNTNGDLSAENSKYITRITGDSKDGKLLLDDFIDPENKYPVIVTTSRLMSTGVDAQTCKLIVLDREIGSMTEFKQIIGRGTRLREDHNKRHFTILDFRRATDKFADPDFDGEPLVIYEPKADDELKEPASAEETDDDSHQESNKSSESRDNVYDPDAETPRGKVYVDGVPVKIIGQQVSFLNERGKLITQDIRDYTRSNVLKNYASLEDFLNKWRSSDRKQALFDELENQGILLHELAKAIGAGQSTDPFDLILHVAYGQQPISRQERAQKLRDDDYFSQYSQKARNVIFSLIDKYADQGIESIETPAILKVQPFSEYGTPVELLDELGGREGYSDIVTQIKTKLYAEV